MSTLNYIWVGPPSELNPSSVPGHDVIGPKEMASINQSPNLSIYFWCLKDHVTFYSNFYKECPLHVGCIEDFIDEAYVKDPVRAGAMAHLLYTMLHANGRNRVKERTIVKDAFAFFLLYISGGYVIDTNVCPLKSMDNSFIDLDAFHIPRISIPSSGSCFIDYDCWLMYSPRQRPERARACFDRFIDNWKECEVIYRNEGNSENYLVTYGQGLIDALLLTDEYGSQGNNVEYWEAYSTNNNYAVIVPSLGLIKYHYNMHLIDNYEKNVPECSNQIFYDIAYGTVDKLTKLLEAGQTLDVRLSNNPEGLTPLHYAIFWKREDMMDVLLQKGANVDERASFTTKQGKVLQCNALEFAQIMEFQRGCDRIRELTEKQMKNSPLSLPSDFWKSQLRDPNKAKKFTLHVPRNGF